jgi:hypothetical protein
MLPEVATYLSSRLTRGSMTDMFKLQNRVLVEYEELACYAVLRLCKYAAG